MKARKDAKHTIHFFDAEGDITPLVEDTFVVQVFLPDGTLHIEAAMSTTVHAADLYLSAQITFTEAGQHAVKFVHSNTTVVGSDTVEVGGTPVTDFPIGVSSYLALDKTTVGADDKVVSVKLLDYKGSSVFGTAKASFTGASSVTTIAISNGDSLTFEVNEGAAKTATFLAAPASVTGGVGGTFAAGAATDILEYSIDGGPTRAVNFGGIAGGIANYVTALNALLKGVFVEEDAGKLKVTTDREGSSANITFAIENVPGNDVTVKTGLVPVSQDSSANLNNVTNAGAVTQGEISLILASAVADVVAGDLLVATWTADDNILLSVTTDPAGAGSKLDLTVGTATLITSLGIAPLGTQGGSFAATGSDGISVQALYDPNNIAYRASHEFGLEGDYFVVWYVADNVGDDPPVFMVERVYVTFPLGKEIVQFLVGTGVLSGNNGTPHAQTTVVVSLPNGKQIAQAETNPGGRVVVELLSGDYKATLFKSGVTFDTNNFSFKVIRYADRPADPELFIENPLAPQAYHFITGTFAPTVTPPIPVAPMCTLFADIYRMTGTPLSNATVQVHLIHRPQLFSGTAVFDTQVAYHTDSNGHIELKLVQGVRVEVSIAPLSVRRIIDVPVENVTIIDNIVWDGNSPVNLLTLLSDSDDVFDILRPNIAPAPRRTL